MLDEWQMLRLLGDALPFGVCVVDRDRNIHYWNHGAELITGHWRQDVMGRSCCDPSLVGCGSEGEPCNGRKACASVAQSTQLGRFFLKHKEGHRLPVLLRSLPLRGEDGLIVAWAEIFLEERAGPEELSWLEEAGARLDPALGIPSLSATGDEVCLRLSETGADLAAFVIGIKDRPQLLRKYGAPMVLNAKRTLAHSLTHLLTLPHFLGCWTDERLLALIFDCSPPAFDELRRKMARLDQIELTWWGDRIAIEVESSGRMLGCPSDSPEEKETILEQLSAGTGGSAAGNPGEMN